MEFSTSYVKIMNFTKKITHLQTSLNGLKQKKIISITQKILLFSMSRIDIVYQKDSNSKKGGL